MFKREELSFRDLSIWLKTISARQQALERGELKEECQLNTERRGGTLAAKALDASAKTYMGYSENKIMPGVEIKR